MEQKRKYQPAGAGSMQNADKAGMNQQDKTQLDQHGKDWSSASKDYQTAKQNGNQAAMNDAMNRMEEAHRQAESIRNQNGYSGGNDGSEYIPIHQKNEWQDRLDKWFQDAKEQQRLETDYAVNQGVADLERAEEEAQREFQTQQDRNDRDERRALDNQALYMEARGDRGGIGHAQYGEIQAQAMSNRQAIHTARTQLTTETARQIADLRARGEFQKADALLKLSQTYLDRLTSLQQWQAEYDMSREQFNVRLDQWQKEFELQAGQVTGIYQGKPTYVAQREEQEMRAKTGMAALQMGIRPSPAQQTALGLTDQQIDAFLWQVRQNKTSGGSRGSGSSRGSRGSGGGGSSHKKPGKPQANTAAPQEKNWSLYEKLYAMGQQAGKPIDTEGEAYLALCEMGYNSSQAKQLARYYMEMIDNSTLEVWWEDETEKTAQKLVSGSGRDWIWVRNVGRMSLKEVAAGLRDSRTINGRTEHRILKETDKKGRTTYRLNPKWE